MLGDYFAFNGKPSWTPRDRTGFTFFASQTGNTTRTRFTELDLSGEPNVRILHKRRLSADRRDQLRDTIRLARRLVNEAIEAVETGEMNDASRHLIKQCFRVDFEEIPSGDLGLIEAGLKKIADGLYSRKLEVKFYNRLVLDDAGHATRLEKAPYCRRDKGFARLGLYSDAFPEVSVKLAACDVQRGAIALIGAVARNAAHLDALTKPVSITRRAAAIAHKTAIPIPNLPELPGSEPMPARESEDAVLLRKQLRELKKLDPGMELEAFASLAKKIQGKARAAVERGDLSREAYQIAKADLTDQFSARCDHAARRFGLRNDRDPRRSGR